MGWVSMFEPEALRNLLKLPEGCRPIAVLCLGHVSAFYQRPMLQEQNWARRCDLRSVVSECGSDPQTTSAPPVQSKY